MKIWMLVIGTRLNTLMFPCASTEIAYRELTKYVNEWWREASMDTRPEDEGEMIDTYFDLMSDTEWYETDVYDLIEK